MNRPSHQGLGMGVGVGMRKAEAHMEQPGRWGGFTTLEILLFSPELGDMAKTGITRVPLFTRQGRERGRGGAGNQKYTEILRGCRLQGP